MLDHAPPEPLQKLLEAANQLDRTAPLKAKLVAGGFNGLVEGKILTGNQPDFPMKYMGFSCNFSQQNQSIDGWKKKSLGIDMDKFPLEMCCIAIENGHL